MTPRSSVVELDQRIIRKMTIMFKALADESRLRILTLLERGPGHSVGEIAEELGLSQSNVSHHLARLVDMGFVSYRRRGKLVYYYISDKCIRDIMRRARNHVT